MIHLSKLSTTSLYKRALVFSLALAVISCGEAGDTAGSTGSPQTQPRLSISHLTYEGAFRLSDQYLDSLSHSMNGSNGVFTINPETNSIFAVGHDNADAIAEFKLPEIVNTTNIHEVKTSNINVQRFNRIFDKAQTVPAAQVRNTAEADIIDTVTGLFLYKGALFVNGTEAYDANANNKATTMIVKDAFNMEASEKVGFFQLQDGAHTAGWVSEIPAEWQSLLGGDLIAGNASNYSINARYSIGPSAYVIDASAGLSDVDNLLAQFKQSIPADPTEEHAEAKLPATPVLNFSLSNFLYKTGTYDGSMPWSDSSNTGYGYNPNFADATLRNDIWTVVSEAHYGFIVPGTRTYMTIGNSGGHFHGVQYKGTQDTGRECGGPCPSVASDIYNYYWLWDVNDFVDVVNGEKQPYELKPYEFGELDTPHFQDASRTDLIGGAYYDKTDNSLYISLKDAGNLGRFDNVPMFIKYSINMP